MSPLTFRPGTIDHLVYRSVVECNEYRIPAFLSATDLIIDVGAHIGSFSWLCWSRGARNIEAFEPESENLACLRRNLGNTSVRVFPLGVWRSDRCGDVLYHSGYRPMLPDGPDPVGMNTGIGNVFATSGPPVETIALDDIIGDRTVSILKLDCEGSEYPILLTAKKLKNVRRIIGEYHLVKEIPVTARVAGFEAYSPDVLVDLFTRLGFRVELVPSSDSRFAPFVGNFFAENMDLQPRPY
jgi:FkbM family methyltransferase